MIPGIAAVLAGLFAWLLVAHFRSLRFFDRPSIARHRAFDPTLMALGAGLVLAGLLLIGSAAPGLGIAAAAGMAALWGYRRFLRSVAFQRWLLRRDYRALRRRNPDLPESGLLSRLVLERHPSWGEELIEQMVLDYPTFEDIARVVVLMERGFRGFR